MTNAKRDENSRPALIAVSSTNGKTIVPIYVTGHSLNTLNVTSGTDYGNVPVFDENSVEVLFGESSDGSGTMINVYATNNALLISNI